VRTRTGKKLCPQQTWQAPCYTLQLGSNPKTLVIFDLATAVATFDAEIGNDEVAAEAIVISSLVPVIAANS
jgi:hypothetical protein